MKESKFQFSNPRLAKLDFMINNGFEKPEKYNGVPMKCAINHKILTPNEKARIAMNLKLGAKENTHPFFLEMEMTADFKSDFNDSEFFKKLIEQNAPALLVSYARPIISLITAQSGLPAFYLPFIDFTSSTASEEPTA